ncbi:MAG: HU family DNA-binding protein [Deltaproteobacteria bacterium]|nr:HU family DNA-binding protein [Deltaproteobacteria bacterium]
MNLKAPSSKVVSPKGAAKQKKITKPKNGTYYTQAELYECLKDCCGLENRRVARSVYDGFAGMIQSALKKGYKVPLPGIGKIQVRQSKARMGRNPATGEIIRIPARKRVRLTPTKALKEAVL